MISFFLYRKHLQNFVSISLLLYAPNCPNMTNSRICLRVPLGPRLPTFLNRLSKLLSILSRNKLLCHVARSKPFGLLVASLQVRGCSHSCNNAWLRWAWRLIDRIPRRESATKKLIESRQSNLILSSLSGLKQLQTVQLVSSVITTCPLACRDICMVLSISERSMNQMRSTSLARGDSCNYRQGPNTFRTLSIVS